MEIYSPNSKSKDLFKLNELKSKKIPKINVETEEVREPYFINAEVVTPRISALEKARRAVADKLKAIFEFTETV